MLDCILINANDYQMNIEFFIDQMDGEWVRQRTIYYLNTKKIKSSREEFVLEKLDASRLLPNIFTSIYKVKSDSINFDPTITTSIYKDKLKDDYNVLFHNVLKKRGSVTFLSNKKEDSMNYSYYIDKNDCLVIGYCRGDLRFNEKIFWISKNLRNTLSMIRIKNKLLSVSFSSEIKINKNLTNSLQ